MCKKLFFAVCLAAGTLVVGATPAKADRCYRGSRTVRSAYVARPVVVAPRSVGVYRTPAYRYVAPGYRPYSSFRPSYGSYIGPGGRFGYGGYGYGRGGVRIGIGF